MIHQLAISTCRICNRERIHNELHGQNYQFTMNTVCNQCNIITEHQIQSIPTGTLYVSDDNKKRNISQ